MADEEVLTPPDSTATKPEAEHAATAVRGRRSSSKKAAAGKADAVSQKAAKPKSRGLSDEEKLMKIKQVEAAVAGGTTLKDAVSAAAISDQTYYTWKKAFAAASGEAPAGTVAFDDELAEFTQLEEENRRLRKLLAEKLRAENAALRRRLGMS
ncbi:MULTISPECIES: transposase [unclassified Rhizobium]|uniref:transposase n=1 Tax=unclassified Rhizobium TaxID=2613769 RepID=UPI000EAA738D|nr:MULTISPECIES: transposase [unclassified Rhizobium]AYG70777.1 SyrB-like regulator [Rhizobium sp. CCGE531]AYG77094.1 SyrB-like regulator [Rhizobium sp. CCGE532]